MDTTPDFTIEDTDIKHQFGMLIVGTIAGFVASKGAHKVYRFGVESYRAHKAQSTVEV